MVLPLTVDTVGYQLHIEQISFNVLHHKGRMKVYPRGSNTEILPLPLALPFFQLLLSILANALPIGGVIYLVI